MNRIHSSNESGDVFISYNRADSAAAKQMSELLESKGLKTWLDSNELAPGVLFQDEIQKAIRQVKSAAILVGPTGTGKWQAAELRSLISQSIERGIPVIPVLLPGVSRLPLSLTFLSEFNWVQFRESIQESDSISRLIWGITGTRPGADPDQFVGDKDLTPRIERVPTRFSPESGRPGHTGNVLFALHGIMTYAAWKDSLFQFFQLVSWQVRAEQQNYGYFSLLKFLSPSARNAKVEWFRKMYGDEIQSRSVLLDQGQYPSIVAHSFGTYILGNALLKYETLRFNKVILIGSILPAGFPWDELIKRGQVQAVRNEYGVKDTWTKLVRWFVAGTGPSGNRGFIRKHERLEQDQFPFKHSDYFFEDHMKEFWLPFLRRPVDPILPEHRVVTEPVTSRPWGVYVLYALLACFVLVSTGYAIVAPRERWWPFAAASSIPDWSNEIEVMVHSDRFSKDNIPLQESVELVVEKAPPYAQVTWVPPRLGILNRLDGPRVVYSATELGTEAVTAWITVRGERSAKKIDVRIRPPFENR